MGDLPQGLANGSDDNGGPHNKFGTFAGVFTPSILTIFGVIMYMRANFVVGQAGILKALLILALAKLITALTAFSISAIATNTSVKGGGAYFLISRTLGPEFGGTIGLALYCAQALSVPFYILGFSEALVWSLGPFFAVPPIAVYVVNFVVLFALFTVSYIGAGWAIRAQYGIMAVLAVSMATFLGGAAMKFDHATLVANWNSAYTSPSYGFWVMFAIYFPAVTGIMAGVNMSGDLKNPSRSLPLGTFLAIGLGLLVYAAEAVLCGGAISREQLVNAPFQSLKEVAPMRWMGVFVTLGVFAATLSSALGSLLGAPRILQALAHDDILRPLRLFAKVSDKGEPVPALWLTLVVSVFVLHYAGGGGGGEALNAVAAVVTMLFLCTYGITNLAAFVESFGGNPSFRPRFRLFHWSLALAGAIGCVFAASLISPAAALGASVLIFLLFLYVRKFVLSTSFGDARRGFVYSRIRENLFKLAQLPVHPKNWRPTSLVLCGNPAQRMTLVKYGVWTAGGRGIVTLVDFVEGQLETRFDARQRTREALDDFIEQYAPGAFGQVVVAPDFDMGVQSLLQMGGTIGPLRPNMLVTGFPNDPQRAPSFARHLADATRLGMSVLVVRDAGVPKHSQKKRVVDIWWRGHDNGSLMVILAYLVSLNHEWSDTTIRVLRAVNAENERAAAEAELRTLIESARMDAKIAVVVAQKEFGEVLREHSGNSSVVLIGFRVPSEGDAERFHQLFSNMLEGLPTTLLVHSTGEADLTT